MKKLFLLQILVLMSLSAVSQSEGLFSVSETKKIVFSQGNLQYHKDSNVWRFAEDQLLYLGENNMYQTQITLYTSHSEKK